MSQVRIAALLMSAHQYVAIVINFATLALVSRLLRPDEIGTAVVGALLAMIAIALREFAAMNFLVQKPDLSQDDKRAAFSVLALITGAAVVALAIGAPWLAEIYDQPVLVSFLRVVALGIFLELFYMPIVALLERDIAFAKVALILTVKVATEGLAKVILAAAGFSSMSFAWAWMISAACTAAVALYLWRDLTIFVPIARRWRAMLTFGFYNGVNQTLHRIYETVPSLVLGRMTSMHAVGLYNRSMSICRLSDRMFLDGVMAVALPALSEKARNKHPLKEPYLRGLSYITAVYWPALLGVVILAHPIVDVVLGSQWTDAAPVVQIISLALMMSFTFQLNAPVLIAIGAMRVVFRRALIVWPISTLILVAGAFFGLKGVAFAFFIAIPIQAYVTVSAVCRHIGVSWNEIFRSLRKSVVVTLITVTGPLGMVAVSGLRFDLTVPEGIIAGVFAAPCWLFGLWYTGHPLLGEFQHIFVSFRQTNIGRKIRGWTAS